MGMLYRRNKRDPATGQLELTGPYWVKYYVNGRPVRESTRTERETEARRFLKEREGRVAVGQPALPRVERIRYEEVADDLRRHYEISGERGLREADARLKPLKAFFTGRRVVSIDAADAERYVQARQAAGLTNGTINRELSMLGKMLRFAKKGRKVLHLPVIYKLKEAPPRQGFFEPEQYQAVRRHLREDLQVAVTIAYSYGWRRSEILTLTLAQVDLKAGTLRLEPGTTKNEEGRLVYLTPELRSLLTAQIERVRRLERRLGGISPYLFPHLNRPHQGTRIRNFSKAWRNACKRAGVPGMLLHDCRRTAVRNLVNAGVPERVSMTITGHRTRAVFDRYHIVSPSDLQEATRKLTGTI